MKRKETLRGVGDQPRQIDDKRRERVRAFSSQADMGEEFTADGAGRMRLDPSKVATLSPEELASMKADIDNLKKGGGPAS